MPMPERQTGTEFRVNLRSTSHPLLHTRMLANKRQNEYLEKNTPPEAFSFFPQKEATLSIEHARALIEKLKNDETFRMSILAIEDVNARLKAIIDAGYSCSIEEIQRTGSEIGPGDDISGGNWLEALFPGRQWYG